MTHRRRAVRIAAHSALFDRRPDGTIYVRSPEELGSYADRITDRLEHWAAEAPDRTFLARRGEDGEWRRINYRETLEQVQSVAQALLDRGLSADRPVAILSGNSIEHGVLALAAMYAGVLYSPIAPAYSLIVKEYGTLGYLFDVLRPGLVFASEGEAFAPALRAALPEDAELVTHASGVPGMPSTPFISLTDTHPSRGLDAAHTRVGPDSIAKILFTSGSTGEPKGVINTQRMLCSNQEQLRTMMAFMTDEPPVLCDWLPWNHTFGGNHNFGLALYNGGTLYIDDGKPVGAGIETTVRNLREIATTAYFNVPRGYEVLLPYLRDDRELRKTFFSRVKMMFYAAAGLGQRFWDELQSLAIEETGEEILMMTGLGATETSPYAISTAGGGAESGVVGLPVPGLELKLVSVGNKLEARVRGPNVTPGFWRAPERTREAFDDEGFYRLGDALRFVDPDDPQKGFLFDGRLNEDYKLSTGTWVSVGPLRSRFLAHFAPFVQDVVFTGHDREFVGALVFPNLAACRTLAPSLGPSEPAETVLGADAVRATFRRLLEDFAVANPGSSTCVRRLILLDRPASLDTGEATEKGSINQKALLACRSNLVQEIYENETASRVIVIHDAAMKTNSNVQQGSIR